MNDSLVSLCFFGATIVVFYLNLAVYKKRPRIWLIPAIPTSLLLITLVQATSTSYSLYFEDTRWLVWLLGPATIAFALPIYQNRKIVRQYWIALIVGSVISIVVSVSMTLIVARLLNLDDGITRSLLSRSVSTPFALESNAHLGGTAQLTGLFVVITGLFGIVLGEVVLTLIPLRTRFAKGAPLGSAAHGFGLSVARGLGHREGAVAS